MFFFKFRIFLKILNLIPLRCTNYLTVININLVKKERETKLLKEKTFKNIERYKLNNLISYNNLMH